MSTEVEFNDSLALAVLVNDLNLNQIRYNEILKCYSNLTNAIQDKFSLFLGICWQNSNIAQNTKNTTQVQHNTIKVDLRLDTSLGLFESKSASTQNLDIEFENDNNYNPKLSSSISKVWLDKIENYDWSTLETKKAILNQQLQQNKIFILEHKDFPDTLKNIKDCPCLLYFQGDPKCFELKKNIAIIGARKMTSYGSKILESILPNLSSLKLGIVSGLALGVDSLAHKLTLGSNSRCIAFIGSGLADNVFYPSENRVLKSQIIEYGGLICSEYPPNFKSMPYTFPRRNRLVASLASITWVTQASKKSGALITAKLALDFGKIVATTPSTIFDPAFEGNLNLIKDGAQIVTEAQDLLGLLNLSSVAVLPNSPVLQDINWSNHSKNAKIIYDKMGFEPQELQDIFLATQIPIPNLNTELSLLELAGLLENLGQGLWVKN